MLERIIVSSWIESLRRSNKTSRPPLKRDCRSHVQRSSRGHHLQMLINLVRGGEMNWASSSVIVTFVSLVTGPSGGVTYLIAQVFKGTARWGDAARHRLCICPRMLSISPASAVWRDLVLIAATWRQGRP